MQIKIESELCTKYWTHHDRIDSGVFSLTLPNANELNIVNVIFTCMHVYIIIVLTVYDFTMLDLPFYLDKNGEMYDILISCQRA